MDPTEYTPCEVTVMLYLRPGATWRKQVLVEAQVVEKDTKPRALTGRRRAVRLRLTLPKGFFEEPVATFTAGISEQQTITPALQVLDALARD